MKEYRINSKGTEVKVVTQPLSRKRTQNLLYLHLIYSVLTLMETAAHILEETATRTGDVLPQEQLALQEHSALNLSTNSFLSGGDGASASLSVEVKARGPQADPEQEQAQLRQAEQEREQCGMCSARTPRLYRNEQGWLCASCAPEKKTCNNEGCDVQNIGMGKRIKHSWYFCERRIRCLVCDAHLLPGIRLQQHYITCEKFEVISGCSRFLIRRTYAGQWPWQWFLVQTVAGQVLCICRYNTRDGFTLMVCTPVPCEQLHLYRCEVQLDCAGKTRTHTPDTLYDDSWDWEVECKQDIFFRNPVVYISLKLSKLE